MKIDVTKTSKNLAAELARRQNNLAKLKGPHFVQCTLHLVLPVNLSSLFVKN